MTGTHMRRKWFPWLIGEPELPYLEAYLDTQAHTVWAPKGAIVGAVAGSAFGIAGGLVGVLAGGLKVPVLLALSPLVAAVAITGLVVWRVYRKATPDERTMADLRSRTQSLLWRLQHARWNGNLKNSLGEDASALLNEGAKRWLELRQTLDEAAWKSAPDDSAAGSARARALSAIDVAMARLLMTATVQTPGFSLAPAPNLDRARALVAEMGEMMEEVARATERLSERNPLPADATVRLREALAEMRGLADAYDEVNETTEKKHHTKTD